MFHSGLFLPLLLAGASLTAQTFLSNGLNRFAGADTSSQSGDYGPGYYSSLLAPAGVAYDAAGNLYIAEIARIRRIDSAGVITTIAGTGVAGYSGDGGPASEAKVFYAGNLTLDSKGNIYFAEDQIHIRRIAIDGSISTFAGHLTNGYNGEGVPAASAHMTVKGLAVDSQDQVYFTDPGSARVRVVRQDGNVYTVAGTGVSGTAGENGPAAKAQLLSPSGIAFDGAGNLYVADTRRVVKVDRNGVLTRIAGDPSLPLNAPALDEVPATATTANAISVAIDSDGNLLVATPRIRRITADGVIHAVAGVENPVTANFNEACGEALKASVYAFALALDPSGNISIANPLAGRVQQITPDGRIRTIAGAGPILFSGDGGPAMNAAFASPSGLAFDGAGNLYIADTKNNRIRMIDSSGNVRTVAGDGGPTYDDDPACIADQDNFLRAPQGIAVDPAGNLYIADTGKSRIRMIATGGAESTIAAAPLLKQPVGVAIDAAGNLYVADSTGLIEISLSGSTTTLSSQAATGSPVLDAAGNLFIPAGSEVDRIGPDGSLSPVAGTGEYFYSAAPGFVSATEEIGYANAVAVDATGSIYVADRAKGAIQRVSGNCAVSAAGSQLIRQPSGLAFDPLGSLYIADAVQGAIWQTVPVPAGEDEKPTPHFGRTGIRSAAVVPLIQPFGEPPLPPYAPPLAPGELMRITGVCMGPFAPVATTFDSNGELPVSAGGVQLTANGIPVPLIRVSSGEILAVSPYGLDGASGATWSLTYGGATTSGHTQVQEAVPAFFTQNDTAIGPAVVVNQDGSMNSRDNPAAKGSMVTFYVTGLGQTDPPGIDGLIVSAPVPQSRLSVRVTIGSQNAQVMDAGAAQGFVGLSQVDVLVPAGLIGQGALPLTLSAGPFTSTQTNVTIWIAP